MITKKDIDIKTYDELDEFSQKVLHNMKKDGVPPTPEYYKIYFQKTLIEEKEES